MREKGGSAGGGEEGMQTRYYEREKGRGLKREGHG